MKVPIDSANLITKIGLILTLVFLAYYFVFWAETSLTSVPQRLTEAIAHHPTNDKLKEAAAYANGAITYTSNARVSVGATTMLYTLIMFVLWGLCSRKIRKTKESPQERPNQSLQSDRAYSSVDFLD